MPWEDIDKSKVRWERILTGVRWSIDNAEDVFELLKGVPRTSFKVPHVVIRIFTRGYKSTIGIVVADAWPFSMTGKELLEKYDIAAWVAGLEGTTATWYSALEGLPR